MESELRLKGLHWDFSLDDLKVFLVFLILGKKNFG